MTTFNRRDVLRAGLVAGVAAATTAQGAAPSPKSPPKPAPFAFEEATLASLQQAMNEGKTTSSALTAAYLERIEKLDPQLHAFIETNPDAKAIAKALDEERAKSGPRGPLHGIPVALKDNLDTLDKQQTTAGSLALVGVPTIADAFVVKRLRDAGAVVLGKTNLSEWANIRSTRATSGWSARGGLARNPYVLDRSASGSSSGSAVAVAANLCAVAVGTETDGSVVCPSSVTGCVGVKPTVGLLSRAGIIPISASQDTAGPIARTVADAAALLTVLAGEDPDDAATTVKGRPAAQDYTKALAADGLKGARLGVVRSTVSTNARVVKLLDEAVAALRSGGATVVDDLKLPELDETTVLEFELKAGMADYLSQRRPDSKLKTLADLIAFNTGHAAEELKWFGQEFFVNAQKRGPLTDAKYKKARRDDLKAARTKGIDLLLSKYRLDALVTVTLDGAALIDLVVGDNTKGSYGATHAAVAGYPALTVPMGEELGLPVGLHFSGPAWSEATLIRYAYAYEQLTKHRRVPGLLPSLSLT